MPDGDGTWYMDREEMKKAIRKANDGVKRYQEHNPHELDYQYWRNKYYEEREASMKLRAQCWDLRDQLLALKEGIRKLIDKVGK